jgi:hypothetical protein
MPNDFANDKGEEFLGKVWVEFADSAEMPQTADLCGFPSEIARGQSVPGLQFADSLGTAESLRQHVDDRGIDIIDAIAQVSKIGNGISSIHHYTLSNFLLISIAFSSAKSPPKPPPWPNASAGPLAATAAPSAAEASNTPKRLIAVSYVILDFT